MDRETTLIVALLDYYKAAAADAEKEFAAADADTEDEGYWAGRLALANESVRLMQTLYQLRKSNEAPG